MKLILLITGIVSAAALNSFSGSEGATESLFIIIYTPGENWDAQKSPQDQAHMASHSRHLSQLRKDGKILMGARYSNKGMIVIEAADEASARRILDVDSALIAKTFSAELYPYSVFYEGCVSK